jgi:hypothetical protein
LWHTLAISYAVGRLAVLIVSIDLVDATIGTIYFSIDLIVMISKTKVLYVLKKGH